MKYAWFYKKVMLLISIFFFSCIKEIDDNSFSLKENLVVNSLITDDSQIEVYLSQTKCIFDTSKFSAIKNINIELWENDNFVGRLDFFNGVYKSLVYPEINSKYQIYIYSEEYGKITATTSIPPKPTLISAKYTIGKLRDEYGDLITEAQIKIKDQSNETNYYELYIGFSETDNLLPIYYYKYYKINDPVLIAEGILDFKPDIFVFSDRLFNGKEVILKLNYEGGAIETDRAYPTKAYIMLRSVSKEYYQFMLSWYKHKYNQNIDEHVEYLTKDFNPVLLVFQGEPVELYSNIEGGYGIFAGYSEVVQQLEFDPDL